MPRPVTPARRKSPAARPSPRKPKPAAAPTPADHYAKAEAELARRIRIWAETWRRCPLKRCRRGGACSREDDCCGVDRTPRPWTEEQREAVRQALAPYREPGPLYDGDARERAAPMPPAPRRG